ncbi:MAG: DUF1737 domain-containing protein [Ignavibacteria bacterium]|nr:DUF1737 domain-containing protein [Ignavibacteria bacterium]
MKHILFVLIVIFCTGRIFSQQTNQNKIYHLNSISELDTKISEINSLGERIIQIVPEVVGQDKYIIVTIKESKFKEYKLVLAGSPIDLEKECKKALADGYELIGGVAFNIINTNMFYVQAFGK